MNYNQKRMFPLKAILLFTLQSHKIIQPIYYETYLRQANSLFRMNCYFIKINCNQFTKYMYICKLIS